MSVKNMHSYPSHASSLTLRKSSFFVQTSQCFYEGPILQFTNERYLRSPLMQSKNISGEIIDAFGERTEQRRLPFDINRSL